MDLPLIFLATSELALHLATKRGLEEEFAFAAFEKDSALVDASLEAAHSIVEALAFAKNCFDGHWIHLPLSACIILTSSSDKARFPRLIFVFSYEMAFEGDKILAMKPNLTPAISVIVPVYRSEKTIERALDSILLYNCTVPYEVLLAFDGGEETKAILERYCQKYPFFRLFVHEKRLGPGVGRIEAIKEAKGEYLAFLDSDDYFLPNALERMYETAKKENADVVNCSFEILEKNGKRLRNAFRKEKAFASKEAIMDAFFGDTFFRSFMCTKLIKKELFEGPFLLFGRKEDLFEDKALLGSVLTRAKRMVSLKEPLYAYDKTNEGSITTAKRTDRHRRSLSVFLALRGFYEKESDIVSFSRLKAHRLRIGASLAFDLYKDRSNGLTKAEACLEKEKEKPLFGKGPMSSSLPDGSLFEERIAFLKD